MQKQKVKPDSILQKKQITKTSNWIVYFKSQGWHVIKANTHHFIIGKYYGPSRLERHNAQLKLRG